MLKTWLPVQFWRIKSSLSLWMSIIIKDTSLVKNPFTGRGRRHNKGTTCATKNAPTKYALGHQKTHQQIICTWPLTNTQSATKKRTQLSTHRFTDSRHQLAQAFNILRPWVGLLLEQGSDAAMQNSVCML
jgi:hypothetical protein